MLDDVEVEVGGEVGPIEVSKLLKKLDDEAVCQSRGGVR